MNKENVIELTPRLLYGFGLLIAWMAILTAIFNFLTAVVLPGVMWMVIGVGIIIILIEGKIVRKLAGRSLPRVNLLFMVAILLLVGLNELYGLVISPPSINFAYLHNVIFVAGYFIILGFIFYQLRIHTRSNRN